MGKKITEEDMRLNFIFNAESGKKDLLAAEKQLQVLINKQEKWNDQIKAMEKDGSATSTRVAEYKKAKEALSQCTVAVEKQREVVNGLNRQYNISSLTMKELATRIKLTSMALREAKPNSEQWQALNRELLSARTRMKELSDQSKEVSSITKQASAIKAGAVATIAAVASVIRGLSGAIGKIAEFEQANADLATIIGKSTSEIKGLTNSALELGRTTEYTASQVTALQTELAKLGFKEESIKEMQEPVLHFATAVGAELPDAAAMAGATLRTFDIEASQTEDALSVLTMGCNNSALSFAYLQTAMSIVGPVAKSFGFSLRDTVALLGTLANSGFDASSAATATRNIILNLADRNGKLAKELGGAVSTFPELIDGLEKLDKKGIDLAKTLELTDKRSVAAFNTFLHGAGNARDLRTSLEDVKGILGTTADARMDTVSGSIKLLQSAWEGLILSMSNSKGIIKEVIASLAEGINGITSMFNGGKGETQQRTAEQRGAEYMRSMWNDKKYWEGEKLNQEKLLADLNADIDKQQRIVKGRETGISNVVGRIQKKRAQKELDTERENLAALLAAREDYYNRLKWEAGTYYDSSGGDDSGGKPHNHLVPKEPGGDKESNWSLDKDIAFLEAKASLTKKYNDGEIKTKEDYEYKMNNLEAEHIQKRLDMEKESGSARAKLEEDLQSALAKNRQEAIKLADDGKSVIASVETDKTKLAIDQENERYEKEKRKFAETEILYENKAAVIEAIERKHKNNLSKIELDSFEKKIASLKTEHETEIEKIKGNYAEEILSLAPNNPKVSSLTKEMNIKIADSDVTYLKNLQTELESMIKSMQSDSMYIPAEEIKKYKLQLEQVKVKLENVNASQANLKAEFWRGTGQGSLFGITEAQWGEFFSHLDESKLKASDVVNVLSAMGQASQEGFKLASQAISMTNAKENESFKKYQKDNEKKRKSLQKRLDDGLMSQAQYDAEVAAMEEDEQSRQEELQIRQAERAKKMDIAQAIINTALGVTKTLAQWGIPWGIAPAAIMAAMGAAQVAMIASTPVTSGAEEGGFVNTRRKQDGKSFKARLSPDKRGFISEPTVLVGENGGEYVIPSEGLDNPTLKPIISTMETARRNGTLKSLNFEAVYPMSYAFGRENGGHTGNASSWTAASAVSGTNSADERGATDKKLLEAIELLNKRLSAPIKADVSMLGKNGILEQAERYNRAKYRGTYQAT